MFGIKLKNVLFILIGSAIFAFGLIHFNIQNKLGEGGFAGIGLILNQTLGVPLWLSNAALNVPLFLVGWRLLGRSLLVYSLIGTAAVTVFFALFDVYQFHIPLTDDLTLASLFAGVFVGIGLGIIFRFGGTTGGVDIIARLVQKYFGWSMGRTMFLFDFIVIAASVVVYLDYKQGMYTIVAVFVGARVIDLMQESGYGAKGATIISQHNEAIAQRIMAEMERGVTILKGQGSYTKNDIDVLYCVVAKQEISRLKTVVTSVDPHAFVAVTDVHDVLGEGFTLDENKQPLEQH